MSIIEFIKKGHGEKPNAEQLIELEGIYRKGEREVAVTYQVNPLFFTPEGRKEMGIETDRGVYLRLKGYRGGYELSFAEYDSAEQLLIALNPCFVDWIVNTRNAPVLLETVNKDDGHIELIFDVANFCKQVGIDPEFNFFLIREMKTDGTLGYPEKDVPNLFIFKDVKVC